MNFKSVTVALIWPTLIKGKGKWKGSMPVCVLSKKFRFNNNHHQEARDYQDLLLTRNQALHQLHSYVPP